jgi:hypothetical protein
MPLCRTALAFLLAAVHVPSVHARTAPVDLAPLAMPQTSNVVTCEVLNGQAASGLFGAPRTLKLLARVSF